MPVKSVSNSYFSGMERNGTVVKTPLNFIPE